MPARPYGREVQHDPRSLAHPVGVLPKSALCSAAWTRRIPVLDQGQLGSCTANAATGALATDSAARTAPAGATITAAGAAASHGIFHTGEYPLDEAFAVLLYQLATRLDNVPGQYEPTDTGSTGLGVAKALKALGLIDSYAHAFSLDAVRAALQTGPVIIGTVWRMSMETPAADGRIPVDPASGVAGGHEVVLDEYDADRDRFWLTNSWGPGWGVQGRGYLTADDLQVLLSQRGDVVAFGWAAPVPPAPSPPTPSGAFTVALRVFVAAAKAFIAKAEAWLTGKET